MNKIDLEKLKDLICFTKESLGTLSYKDDVALSQRIFKWIKNGQIIKLKKGLYVTKDQYELNKDNLEFKEYISSVMRSPSYISMEYVLRKYMIIKDADSAVTCITKDLGRIYVNKISAYKYKSITNNLYVGFEKKSYLNNNYYIASKSKALFDYLFFKMSLLPDDLSTSNVASLLQLNMSSFTTLDLNELSKFANISKNRKMQKIIQNIINNFSIKKQIKKIF